MNKPKIAAVGENRGLVTSDSSATSDPEKAEQNAAHEYDWPVAGAGIRGCASMRANIHRQDIGLKLFTGLENIPGGSNEGADARIRCPNGVATYLKRTHPGNL